MNQSERDKIVKAGDYLETVYDGITDPGVGGKGNTIKEIVYGKLFKEKGQESHHYIKLNKKIYIKNYSFEKNSIKNRNKQKLYYLLNLLTLNHILSVYPKKRQCLIGI